MIAPYERGECVITDEELADVAEYAEKYDNNPVDFPDPDDFLRYDCLVCPYCWDRSFGQTYKEYKKWSDHVGVHAATYNRCVLVFC